MHLAVAGDGPVTRDIGTHSSDAPVGNDLTICVTQHGDVRHKAATSLIEAVYARTYGARVTSHYRRLVSVHRGNEPLAAAGFRPASEERLYLEGYLSAPVEHDISRRIGRPVPRSDIVEIGNLSSISRSASVLLFRAMADHIGRAGFAYAVATSTTKLRTALGNLGLETFELGTADATRLPDHGTSWGTYYAAEPAVIYGDISASARHIAALPQTLRPAGRPRLERPLAATAEGATQ